MVRLTDRPDITVDVKQQYSKNCFLFLALDDQFFIIICVNH